MERWVIRVSKFLEFSEAPRAQRGASRKGDFFYIVALDSAYTAELTVHLPVNLLPLFQYSSIPC
jgi:hypothetical protein